MAYQSQAGYGGIELDHLADLGTVKHSMHLQAIKIEEIIKQNATINAVIPPLAPSVVQCLECH
jgi:hypothetical protein